MTVRYFSAHDVPTLNGDWWQARGSDSLARVVHEADRSPVDTKLLDANGIKIFRVHEPEPMGFIPPKEVR